MSAVEAIRFEHPGSIAEEDQARADFYALLANLFYRAPDERLLQAILIAPEPTAESDHVLVEAWAALAATRDQCQQVPNAHDRDPRPATHEECHRQKGARG